jgi:hypothetical protein
MIAHSLSWNAASGWSKPLAELPPVATLVLCFGSADRLTNSEGPAAELRRRYPGAVSAACSTAGEICDAAVSDDGLTALLLTFAQTKVRGVCASVKGSTDSEQAGSEIGRGLLDPELRHVLVLSDGLAINGTALTAGLRGALPADVPATGGLAGDGARFQRTVVGLGDKIGPGQVVGIGFYGAAFRAEHGSAGGWQPFGPKRRVTGAEANVLYTLDDKPALALYKRYLGDLAVDLPGSGLLFPLQLLSGSSTETGLVRTILAVDEERQSLTFAGDLPVGHYVRLMKAGTDALVEGARLAAESPASRSAAGPRAAFLVSCVGRKLVLGQRVEEEVEAVLRQLGAGVSAAGFYSYGEICPAGLSNSCELHNQTMTLTVIGEAP